MDTMTFFNPFKPGAGHKPPYLAGRRDEKIEFRKLLQQTTILENCILTGLRGVGKTVLLDEFRAIAISNGWVWVGTDMSESSTVDEDRIATRLLADVSVFTASLTVDIELPPKLGFNQAPQQSQMSLSYRTLRSLYDTAPGLVSDKLKYILEYIYDQFVKLQYKGIVFAYDEAQNLADHAKKEQFPLSLLLEVFQSLQRKGIPFLLVLTGLPTLFPKLVEARTYSERMFKIIFLDRLSEKESREAILNPIAESNSPTTFDDDSLSIIVNHSAGYPYFIQFICREVFDIFVQEAKIGRMPMVPIEDIIRKLDKDFFSGRWARVTDGQRELLQIIAHLDNSHAEFTVNEISLESKKHRQKPFSRSHINQMLASLINKGLVYKNRHGRYSFAVPLLDKFILRQMEEDQRRKDEGWRPF